MIGRMTEQPTGVVPVFSTGDRLRKAREVAGLDQEPFAELLGVSRGTVSNYERSTTERRKPIVLRAWALATGVSLEWLQTGQGETPGPGLPDTEAASELARYTQEKRRRSVKPDKRRYRTAA